MQPKCLDSTSSSQAYKDKGSTHAAATAVSLPDKGLINPQEQLAKRQPRYLMSHACPPLRVSIPSAHYHTSITD